MKSQEKTIIVKKYSSGTRLDHFLVEKLKLSRSLVQKMIEAYQVTVNEKMPKTAGNVVRKGDHIVIASEARQSPSFQNQAKNKSNSKNRGIGLPRHRETASSRELLLAMTPIIIAETPDYIIVNKPSGLLVHPTQAEEKNSLVSFLKKKYPEIKNVGDDPKVRPGIVHRLDKEASGLLVVARTQKMFDQLKNQFKNRTVEKEYWALAHGRVAKDWDEINFPIARSETADRMAARPMVKPSSTVGAIHELPLPPTDEDGAKSAKTEFLVEKRFVNFTLLRVTLHTGRMHQIRVHLLAYNHPLVGDPLYWQKKRKRMWDEKLGRLFLHSTKLSFLDLQGEKQTFESPLPKELKEFLETLS